MATSTPQGLSPEVRAHLQALGIRVKAWDPRLLEAVVRGHKTLADVVGVTKEQQLELASTGLQLLKDGFKDKARTIFEGLEALDPYDAYVQACLGALDVEEGKTEEGEKHLDRALLLNPTSAPALLTRGELRARQGKRAEALADLEAAAKSTVPGNKDVAARARAVLEALKKAP